MTNHKRNTMKRFLSTFVLLFIVAAGFCKDPKYIFYFIGDGMGPIHTRTFEYLENNFDIQLDNKK